MSDNEWYYLSEGQSAGPVAREQLAALYHRKEIGDQTLVWRQGLERWMPTVEAFPNIARTPPPLPSDVVGDLQRMAAQPELTRTDTVRAPSRPIESHRNAVWTDVGPHPWRRYFARMFDTVTNGALSIFGVALLTAWQSPPAYRDFSSALDNRVVASIVTCLAAIPLNALLIGFTGGTLGKWLFGVRVLSQDRSTIGFGPALAREGAVWLRGMGLGIPIVVLVTCIVAFNHLRRAGTTSWDQKDLFMVVHRPMGVWQVVASIIGIIAFLSIVVGLAALGTK